LADPKEEDPTRGSISTIANVRTASSFAALSALLVAAGLVSCSSRYRLPLLAVTSFNRETKTYSLFVADPVSGAQVLITDAAASHPAWSPDGRSLAFLVQEAGEEFGGQSLLGVAPTLQVYDADTARSRSLPLGVEPRSLPVWTPDGEYLVFSATVPNQQGRDLYQVRADGSGLERLTTTEAYEMTPGEWSADGEWLTVGVNDWEYSEEAQAEICGGECWGRLAVFPWPGGRMIIPHENATISCPNQWSPNGAVLAFLDNCTVPHDPPDELFVWDASSLETRQVTAYERPSSGPGWGVQDFAWVDDDVVYFTTWDGPTPLYEVDVSSRATRLLQEADGLRFGVSRDREGHVWLVVAKGNIQTGYPVEDATWVLRDGEEVFEEPVSYRAVWAPGAVAMAATDWIQDDPIVVRLVILSGFDTVSPTRLEIDVSRPLGRLIWAPAVGTPVFGWGWIALGVVAVLAGGVAAWLIRGIRSRHDRRRWSPQP
jgi:hypothetical protein